MASQAEEFYRQIEAAPKAADFLENLVTIHQAENEFLDFKNGKIQGSESSLRKTWSQSLSAYGNTGGGVLVFGIDARQAEIDGVRIDVAHAIDLVAKPEALVQTLKDLHISATEDVVGGIEYLCVKQPDGRGYVVCLIPEGKQKPYRAKLDGNVYYQRIGDKCLVIPHPLLRTMFHPRSRASVQIAMKIGAEAGTKAPVIRGNITIKNTGILTAREMVVVVSSERIMAEIALGDWRSPGFGGSADHRQLIRIIALQPLHSGEQMDVLKCVFPFQHHYQEILPMAFRFDVYMADQEPLHYWHSLRHDQFLLPSVFHAVPFDVRD
jgi:hypothetical protein